MPLIGDLWAGEDEAAEIWAAVAEADAELDADAMVQDFVADQELARARDELRADEDAREDEWRRDPRWTQDSTEAKLARAYKRIGQGSYTPPPGVPDPGRDSMAQPGRVTGSHNCGPSDDLGYCMNRGRHEMTCGSLATSEMGEALAASGEYARRAAAGMVLDATGNLVMRQGNVPASWADVLAAHAGHAVHGDAAFERDRQGRPELPVLHTAPGPGAADENLVERARAAMGISTPRTARERGLDLLTARTAAQMAGWQSGRIPHADYGESTRERAARLHQPVTLRASQHDPDGVPSGYMAG